MQLAEGQDAYQLLAAPWNELWLNWLDEGNNAYKQQAQDSSQMRLQFVQSLVATALMRSSTARKNGNAAGHETEMKMPEETKTVSEVNAYQCYVQHSVVVQFV